MKYIHGDILAAAVVIVRTYGSGTGTVSTAALEAADCEWLIVVFFCAETVSAFLDVMVSQVSFFVFVLFFFQSGCR
jgi:hypothetical protein